jgi:hypothetical protein
MKLYQSAPPAFLVMLALVISYCGELAKFSQHRHYREV